MPKNRKLLCFDRKDEVETPSWLYDNLNEIFNFDFDPCPIGERKFDGLKVEWGKMNFVNPPYSSIGIWVKKALAEREKGKNSLFLITARTNTNYWQDFIFPNATKIVFLRRVVTFKGFINPFPMALAIVYFGDRSLDDMAGSYPTLYQSGRDLKSREDLKVLLGPRETPHLPGKTPEGTSEDGEADGL